jgi:hypothetical protein
VAVQGYRGFHLLTSPVFACTVLMLAVNDHLLKQRWPGLITGKLSDFAGVIMVAILLTAILKQPRLAFALTGVSFVILKSIPAAATLAAPILGGSTVTDQSDLVALVGLVPLWYWMRSLCLNTDPGGILIALPLQLFALGAAALTMSATSCYDEGVQSLRSEGSLLVAHTDDNNYYSADGGATWSKVRGDAPQTATSSNDNCSQDGTCFRVDRGQVIQIKDGVKTVSLSLTGLQLENAIHGATPKPQCDLRLENGDLAVIDVADGGHVVVEMGPLGVLHRDPISGWAWVPIGPFGTSSQTQIGPPSAGVPRETDNSSSGIVYTCVLLLTPLAVAVSAFPARKHALLHGRKPGPPTTVSVVSAGVLLVIAVGFIGLSGLADTDLHGYAVRRFGAIAIFALGCLVVIPHLIYQARSRPSTQPPPNTTWPLPPPPSG